MLEGPGNNPESFENFKDAVIQIYKIDGWSEKLNDLIGVWHNKRYQETDLPGGTIEQRVVFQIELALIYLAVERNESAYRTLGDAWDQANNDGLTGLVTKITEMMNNVPEF